MTDRVEEIKQEVSVLRLRGASIGDIRFLLSEIQRLRKVEAAAREFMQDAESDGGEFAELDALRASLSNALEQPEPVIQEMER